MPGDVRVAVFAGPLVAQPMGSMGAWNVLMYIGHGANRECSHGTVLTSRPDH